MIKVTSYEDLLKIPEPQENDNAFVEKDSKCYTFKDGKWTEEQKLTAFELSQMILTNSEKVWTDEEILQAFAQINYEPNDYYALISFVYNYFTVFKTGVEGKDSFPSVVLECLKNIGPVKYIGFDADQNAFEIWAIESNSQKAISFYLINFNKGVEECL